MPRPPMRMLVALGAAAALTLAACGTTIVGAAVPDPAGLVEVNSPTIGVPTDAPSTDSTTESTDTTTTDESSTESTTESTDDTTTDDTTTDQSTTESTTDDTTTDDTTTDETTDEGDADGAYDTTLPADWPAEIALPDGSVIGFSYSDDSGKGVYFDTNAAAADVVAFLDAELLANGWVQAGDYSDDTSFTKSYSDPNDASYSKTATVSISDNGDGTSSSILVFTGI